MAELKVKIKKKLNKLLLEKGDHKGEFDIVDGELDIIEVDQWVTELLKREYDKYELQRKLSGK